ncbi:hypothetical protein [Chloroflexus sp. MS-G]|jgi:hypothetical protein|uniref:hypothetical protein n=1 Tax=Chloroflexus sp. MS-G TaxID=1521187 RepID=UPI0004DF5C16|nr:hypothetical protein [Chloroflexus sp. MS-G]
MIDTATSSRDACYQRLQNLFSPGELVWIESEEYNNEGMFWRVTLLCRNTSGRWERRRYRYDVLSAALFFMGATPVSDEEAARIRRTAPRLVTGHSQPARIV